VYSEYYCNLVAAWARTLQEDKIFVRLDEQTIRHFHVWDTLPMCEAPDGQAAYALYGKTRRAMDVFLWGNLLMDVFRRDTEAGDAQHVRVTVDETKEYGMCLRHTCVDSDWAPCPNAPAHVAPVPPKHLAVWRRGRQTQLEEASAIGGDRGCYHRPRLPRHDRSRSPLRDRSRSLWRDRSRSASLPRAIEATWPARASFSAAVALFESASVRDVRFRGPVGLLCRRWRMSADTQVGKEMHRTKAAARA